MDIPISDRMMNGQPADDDSVARKSSLFILPPQSQSCRDGASSQRQDKSRQVPRFLGREYLTDSRQNEQPADSRKGMFLGRECVIDRSAPTPAQPQKRGKVRFLGREIL